MTDVTAARTASFPKAGVSFIRVFRSELIKFRTLRSSYVILAIAVVLLVGLAAIIAGAAGSIYNQSGGTRGPIQVPAESLDAVLGGLMLAQLAIGVLGVTIGTNEYSTGMIRATLAAVPTRWPVLVAKALLVFLVAAIVMIPATFVAFFVGQAIIRQYGLSVSLSQPGVLRAMFGAGLYLGMVAMLGLAFGWIIRSAAGAIATLLGVLLLLPVILPLIQYDWVQKLQDYLPSTAGQLVYSILPGNGPLGPWSGYAVAMAYSVVFLIVAAILLKRRDA